MSTNTNNSNIVRSLGIFERYFQIHHDIDYYYNVGLLIRYKVPLNLSLTSSSIPDEVKITILRILYPTLEQTILKQPELAVAFADIHSSKPLFIRLHEMDLNRLIRFTVVNYDKDIEQLLEEEHDKKFNVEDQTLPLWRMVVGIKGSYNDEQENIKDWNLFIGIFWH